MMAVVHVPKRLTIVLISAIVVGCSSQIPLAIKQAPENNPDVQFVRTNPDCCVGQNVRWGGDILSVENRPDTTRITVLSKPLRKSGEPKQIDTSAGRFVAEFPGFLDPELYPSERRLTVVGKYTGVEKVKIGEYLYVQPVLDATHHYVWPELEDDPFYYYPWYPWYPYPYPYYYPYHPFHYYP